MTILGVAVKVPLKTFANMDFWKTSNCCNFCLYKVSSFFILSKVHQACLQ